MLGLPDATRACLFDLDGVLTDTASVHAAAWKQMFDDFLRARAQRTGEPFVPFDVKADYGPYVDGKPRLDGTRGFLASRGITLPEGDPSDGPGAETVIGLATRKNELVHHTINAGRIRKWIVAGHSHYNFGIVHPRSLNVALQDIRFAAAEAFHPELPGLLHDNIITTISRCGDNCTGHGPSEGQPLDEVSQHRSIPHRH